MFGFENINKKFVVSIEFNYYLKGSKKDLKNSEKLFYENGSLVNLNFTDNIVNAHSFSSKNDVINLYEDIKNNLTLDMLNELSKKFLKGDIEIIGYKLAVVSNDLNKEYYWSQSYFK